jgi:hypothetical protein
MHVHVQRIGRFSHRLRARHAFRTHSAVSVKSNDCQEIPPEAGSKLFELCDLMLSSMHPKGEDGTNRSSMGWVCTRITFLRPSATAGLI